MNTNDAAQSLLEQFLAESRKLNGREIQERGPWHQQVTADAIRHMAFGISDDNPLWLDRSYAANSRYRRIVAPPAFLTSVLYPALHGQPMSVPLSSLISELEYQWFMPVLEGETLVGLITLGDVVKYRLEEVKMEKDALEGMIMGY